MDMSVQELVKKAKYGDDSAFSVLVRRFQDMALATAVASPLTSRNPSLRLSHRDRGGQLWRHGSS